MSEAREDQQTYKKPGNVKRKESKDKCNLKGKGQGLTVVSS